MSAPDILVQNAMPVHRAALTGGANQVRVRAYNERLVLSLVRLHGSLSKADITRRSGLSAQTVSVIMRSLEKEGLLLRGEPVRGKVGPPSVPIDRKGVVEGKRGYGRLVRGGWLILQKQNNHIEKQ